MISNYKLSLRKKYTHFIILTTIISLIITFLNFLGPFVMKYAVDQYGNSNQNINFFTLFFIIFTGSYITRGLSIILQHKFAYKFKVEESKTLYQNMFKMKYEKLNSLEPTYLVEKINISVNTLFDLFSNSISSIIIAGITIIVCLILIEPVNQIIFTLFLCLVPLQYFGYKKLNKKLSEKSMKLQSICAKNFKDILAIVSNIDFIKQSGNHNELISLLDKSIRNIEKENSSVSQFAKIISVFLDYSIKIIHNGIYIYTVFLFLNQSISLSNMVFISLISSIYFPALSKITETNINLRDLKGVLHFVEKEILDNIELNGNIEVDVINNISFKVKDMAYEKVLIKQGEFSVNKGDIIAIVGKSGCGKSTLMKGLMKLVDINDIYINNVELSNYNNKSLRNKISFFSQNILILPITIKENILLGRKDAMIDWNRLSSKPFMKKFFDMPEGLDTVIFENGSNLSGGDKQKIALARIYTEKPDIIILDEVTNSIDKQTSLEIIQDIVNTFSDNIIFIISHDDYIVDYCNRIIKIENQRITEINNDKYSSIS